MAKKSKDVARKESAEARPENAGVGWTQIQLPEGLVPDDLPRNQRFDVFVTRFKSSSPECELFIHDPLQAMLDAGIIKSTKYRVTTHVLNHERTLSKWHLFVTAQVSTGAIGLTLYKVAPPRES